MDVPVVVYCGGGNKRFAEIALDSGMMYGSQLPETTYFPLWFADQDWQRPRRADYVAAVAAEEPYMATVLDYERPEQWPEVCRMVEEIAPYVEVVGIIPKFCGAIEHIPPRMAGVDVRLCYSVPTRYGGTAVPVWEFGDREVHLLGGAPHKQLELARYMRVVSVDGNYAHRMAVKHCAFWEPGTARYASNRFWPTVREAGKSVEHDAPYLAFRLSCAAIMSAWRGA